MLYLHWFRKAGQRLSPRTLWFFILSLALALSAACTSPGTPAILADPTLAPSVTDTPLPAATATRRNPGLTPTPRPPVIKPLPPTPKSTRVQPPTPTATQAFSSTLVLGDSTGGWPIQAFRFGTGPVRLALIGGIHGGYEWNTILLAYQAIDYFSAHPDEVPAEITLFIVPSANPDGQVKIVGHTGRFSPKEIRGAAIAGRLNSDAVDLNRNWDCHWEPVGVWRNEKVSAGKTPFSEAETQVLRDFLAQPPMAGVVFWHSAVPAVYAGGCDSRFSPSDELAKTYARDAGYPFQLAFTEYPVTGAAVDWLATQGIPAIEVELNNHTDTDWDQNLKGITGLLAYYQDQYNQSK